MNQLETLYAKGHLIRPTNRPPRVKKGAHRLRKVSKKRDAQLREYTKLRKKLLKKRPYCEAWGRIWPFTCFPPSVECHHVGGRIGAALLDPDNILCVSREAHLWIHSHPFNARRLGLLK